MESWLRSIFLSAITGLASTLPALSVAQDAGVPEAPPPVIEPAVERRDLDVGAIDTENFEVTAFLGIMSIEDFETGVVFGGRLAYHINETLFLEGSLGTTEAGKTSLERAVPVIELIDDRNLTYYDLSLGWSVLPSESFYGGSKAFNSSFYLIGGLGSVDFADDSNFSVNFGFGFKILLNDSFAARIEARDYLFDVDIEGAKKTLNNMQGTVNFSWFF